MRTAFCLGFAPEESSPPPHASHALLTRSSSHPLPSHTRSPYICITHFPPHPPNPLPSQPAPLHAPLHAPFHAPLLRRPITLHTSHTHTHTTRTTRCAAHVRRHGDRAAPAVRENRTRAGTTGAPHRVRPGGRGVAETAKERGAERGSGEADDVHGGGPGDGGQVDKGADVDD